MTPPAAAAPAAPARARLRLPGPPPRPGPAGQSAAGPFRDAGRPERRPRPWRRPGPAAQSTALPAGRPGAPLPGPRSARGAPAALTAPPRRRQLGSRRPALAGPLRARRWGSARGERRGGRRDAGTKPRCPVSGAASAWPASPQPARPSCAATGRPPHFRPERAAAGAPRHVTRPRLPGPGAGVRAPGGGREDARGAGSVAAAPPRGVSAPVGVSLLTLPNERRQGRFSSGRFCAPPGALRREERAGT